MSHIPSTVPQSSLLVEAPCGPVRGVVEGSLRAFHAIPYAESPGGTHRFLPPAPRETWMEPLDASKPGPRAMQNPEPWGPAHFEQSEDCLHLTLWAPEDTGTKHPVVVQIHGGGHFAGFSDDPFLNGPRFVRNKDMIFVSINYRLGTFGYLDVSRELGPAYAASGSNGMLDQIQALRWVRDNIAAFGGDPKRVTVMGQSAGAKSIAALLLAPAARGLFHGAILQSGSFQCIRDQKTAHRITDLFLKLLDLRDPRDLLTLPAEALLAAQSEITVHHAPQHLYAATVDGVSLTEAPGAAIEAGRFAHVPVLLGYNRDEVSMPVPDPAFDETSVETRLTHAFGCNASHVLRAYHALTRQMAPSVAFGQVMTTYSYGIGCLHLTRLLAGQGSPVWSYLWELGRNHLAHHSSELPYLFGYTTEENPEGYDKTYHDMSESIHAAWDAFIRSGNPQIPAWPYWPPCTIREVGHRMRLSLKPWVEQLDLQQYDKSFSDQVFILRETTQQRRNRT